MSVQAFSLLGVLEAQTAAFEARMASAGKAVDRLTSEQVVATRAVGQFRIGLQGMAQQALGTTGPLGQLTSSVVGLFGGAVGLAAVAGAGAIALAIKAIGTAAEAEAVRVKKLDDAIKALLSERGPNVAVGGERQRFLEELATRERELGTARAEHGQIDRFGEMRDNSKKIGELTTEISRLQVLIGLLNDKLGVSKADLLLGASVRDIAGLSGGLDLRNVPTGAIPGTPISRDLGGRFDLLTPQQMLDMLEPSPEERAREREERLARLSRGGASVAADLDQMMRAPGQQAVQAQMRQMALINAGAGGLGMLASGGSAAGFLSAGGGVVGLFNPIAGAIVSGLGTVLSGLDNREERRHREQLEALKAIAQDVGLDRVTVVFTGPDGHQIRKTLAELESVDAVERVPAPAGAAG